MKIKSLLCACILALTIPLWGQNAQSPQMLARTSQGLIQGETTSVATSTAGNVVYAINMTIATTALASSDVVSCTGHASVNDYDPTTYTQYASYNDSQTVTASVKSGSPKTASCTVTVPYSWTLMESSTDTLALEYEIAITSSTGVIKRHRDVVLGYVPIPLNGAITSKTINATL